jgi:hypothetical protein
LFSFRHWIKRLASSEGYRFSFGFGRVRCLGILTGHTEIHTECQVVDDVGVSDASKDRRRQSDSLAAISAFRQHVTTMHDVQFSNSQAILILEWALIVALLGLIPRTLSHAKARKGNVKGVVLEGSFQAHFWRRASPENRYSQQRSI